MFSIDFRTSGNDEEHELVKNISGRKRYDIAHAGPARYDSPLNNYQDDGPL